MRKKYVSEDNILMEFLVRNNIEFKILVRQQNWFLLLFRQIRETEYNSFVCIAMGIKTRRCRSRGRNLNTLRNEMSTELL